MGNSKVDLTFLRHALADWPHWTGSDDDRPITEEGKKETHVVAAFLNKQGVAPQKIFTSPLPRAVQTAEIVAKHIKAPLLTSACLAKGFNAHQLWKLLDQEKIDDAILVGHEPDFSATIQELTGGSVKLKKSGVARLRLDRAKKSGRLLWLFPPAICGS